MPGKIDLVRAVSKRLFIAIFVLVIVFFTTLVVTISATNLPSSTVLLVLSVRPEGMSGCRDV
jgi:uncharacterized protein involved in exopolysaccharide biosynthesis